MERWDEEGTRVWNSDSMLWVIVDPILTITHINLYNYFKHFCDMVFVRVQ